MSPDRYGLLENYHLEYKSTNLFVVVYSVAGSLGYALRSCEHITGVRDDGVEFDLLRLYFEDTRRIIEGSFDAKNFKDMVNERFDPEHHNDWDLEVVTKKEDFTAP